MVSQGLGEVVEAIVKHLFDFFELDLVTLGWARDGAGEELVINPVINPSCVEDYYLACGLRLLGKRPQRPRSQPTLSRELGRQQDMMWGHESLYTYDHEANRVCSVYANS